MAAMLIDSESIDFARSLIVSGSYEQALAALDILTARSPRSEDRQATSKQRYYLHTLTGLAGGGWPKWKTMLLPIADAKRMIDELLGMGETAYGVEHYRISETAKSKRKHTTEIPW